MALQSLTIQLPDSVYKRLLDVAQSLNRPLEEATVELINSAVDEERLPNHLGEKLDQLQFLSDDELWNAAKMHASNEDSDQMQGLLEKRGREGLTSGELEQVNALSNHFNQIMLVRAKAAVLLKDRGHNISTLLVENE